MAAGGGPRFAGAGTAAAPAPQQQAQPSSRPRVFGSARGLSLPMLDLSGVPDEVKALWLLVGLEVAFLLWHRHYFRAAHGG